MCLLGTARRSSQKCTVALACMGIGKLLVMALLILAYYLEPSEYTKALPALNLAILAPNRFAGAAMFLAAAGDYLLEKDENPIPGILSFLGCHLFLIDLTQMVIIHSNLKGKKKWFILPALILSGTAIAITTQVEKEIAIPIFLYTHVLATLLLCAVADVVIWHGNKLIWPSLNPELLSPVTFLCGVIVFIISDIFVLGELVEIDDIPPIGLPLYWSGISLINLSFGWVSYPGR